ncbi:hypothetical protein [Nocardioides sp.]|uniref:hypothetical protein n=1 Tax=Nocardioides sp. TaxID=35761 RepID=UPI002615233F|nr:hypothetical protein [Nocardioides sp.]
MVSSAAYVVIVTAAAAAWFVTEEPAFYVAALVLTVPTIGLTLVPIVLATALLDTSVDGSGTILTEAVFVVGLAATAALNVLLATAASRTLCGCRFGGAKLAALPR